MYLQVQTEMPASMNQIRWQPRFFRGVGSEGNLNRLHMGGYHAFLSSSWTSFSHPRLDAFMVRIPHKSR